MRYSRNLSFIHKKNEYLVGDFVETTKDQRCIYRIESIFYETNTGLHPTLAFRARKYMKAKYFNIKHRHLLREHQLNEIICLNESSSFYPSHIYRKISVIPVGQDELPHDYTCSFIFEDGQLKPYQIVPTIFCNEYVIHGTLLLLLRYYLITYS